MILRKSKTRWSGTLKQGRGQIVLGDDMPREPVFSFASRFGNQPGTSPEQMIASAHAACFSMALAGCLEEAGVLANNIDVVAQVLTTTVETEPAISSILLQVVADVPGIDEATFATLAKQAKNKCLVSRALAGVEIRLEAVLSS